MDERELIRAWMDRRSEMENEPYTFRALAEDAGINPNYLSNVMTGLRNPGVKTLQKIASAFGLSRHDFYKGPGDQRETTSTIIPESQVQKRDCIPQPSQQQPVQPVTQDPPEQPKQPVQQINDDGDIERSRDSMRLSLSQNSSAELDAYFGTLGMEIPDEFYNGGDIPATIATDTHHEREPEKQLVPPTQSATLIPLRCSAGDICNSDTTFPRYVGSAREKVFAICLCDDSMAPELHLGDILYLDPDTPFVSTKGGIGVVHHDDSFLVRKVYDQGDSWLCVPINGSYTPELVPKTKSLLFKVLHWFPRREGMF